jgi:hypothetical protein
MQGKSQQKAQNKIWLSAELWIPLFNKVADTLRHNIIIGSDVRTRGNVAGPNN